MWLQNALTESPASKSFSLSISKFYFLLWPALKFFAILHCTVPENIHIPPTEGIGISWGVGVLWDQKIWRHVWSLIGISRGVEVLEKKSLLWGRYGYFLELHIMLQKLWKVYFAHNMDFYTHDTFTIKHIK